MTDTKPLDGDSVIILSSDLIATVMEQYFNDHLFRKPVQVIDLSPTANGYAFTLSFGESKHVPTVTPNSKKSPVSPAIHAQRHAAITSGAAINDPK